MTPKPEDRPQADRAEPIPEESLLAWHSDALTEAERRALAERIDGDAGARATLSQWRHQDAAIASLYTPLGDEPLPGNLREIFYEARIAPAPARRSLLRPTPSGLLLVALVLIFGLGLGWAAHEALRPAAPGLAAEAARAYETYVVDTAHPVELAATDTRLTAWVAGRIGHVLPPPDFTSAGFALMGGRVLPSAHGPAALYMYQDAAGQRAALYVVARQGGARTAPRFFADGRTRGLWWVDRDLGFAVTGGLPRPLLERIATLAYDQLL